MTATFNDLYDTDVDEAEFGDIGLGLEDTTLSDRLGGSTIASDIDQLRMLSADISTGRRRGGTAFWCSVLVVMTLVVCVLAMASADGGPTTTTERVALVGLASTAAASLIGLFLQRNR